MSGLELFLVFLVSKFGIEQSVSYKRRISNYRTVEYYSSQKSPVTGFLKCF